MRLENGQFFQDIRSQLENDFMKSLQAEVTDDYEAEAIRPLSWYPGNVAWHLNFSRMQLRKNQALERFHEFLKQENEIGNITRQEAISMVPPLFLDVLPDHHILDNNVQTYGSYPENCGISSSTKVAKVEDLGCSRFANFGVAYRYAVMAVPVGFEGFLPPFGDQERYSPFSGTRRVVDTLIGTIEGFRCRRAFHFGRGSGSRERFRLELATEGFGVRHMAGLGTHRAGPLSGPGA
uniref:Uncharacterized protein n=1 Tax=Ananas comosus var. bracteatus TaxID=296719 RepID=A0A6V7PXX9_ANACO|nr:unnamed protein product [Ananas comosus var. bracteatus]